MDNIQYKHSPAGVQRLPDSVFIPNDMGNKDWVAYMGWVTEGGRRYRFQTLMTMPMPNAVGAMVNWSRSNGCVSATAMSWS